MPSTPRRHFDEDITRARDLLALAVGAQPALQRDLHLSAIAMAVGAMDAYLCDAYVDCLTAVLRAYHNQSWAGQLPSDYAKKELPAGYVLNTARTHRPLWSIRMAARKIMERDDMLSISRLEEAFNPILPSGQKLWQDVIDRFIHHGHRRLTRYVPSDFTGLTGKTLTDKKKESIAALKRRLAEIIQVRHDWIHNCGRPKAAIQSLTAGQTHERIRDIVILVTELDQHIDAHRRAN